MVKYPLISCDFDGTLTRSDGKVSEYTRRVVAEYIKRGGTFMVNTGRMFRDLKNDLAGTGIIEANMPVSVCNGAVIAECGTEKIIGFKGLTPDEGYAVAKEAERLGVYIQTYKYDMIMIGRGYGSDSIGVRVSRHERSDYTLVSGTISEFIKTNNFESAKMMVIEENTDKINSAAETLRKKFPSILFHFSVPFMLEINNAGAGKDKACDAMCAKLGISIERCAAFGDGQNDVAMLKHAGLGVALAHAPADVRTAADRVAPHCDEDGAAKAIEEFCF